MGLILAGRQCRFLSLWFPNVLFSHQFPPVKVITLQLFSIDEQSLQTVRFHWIELLRVAFTIKEFLNDRITLLWDTKTHPSCLFSPGSLSTCKERSPLAFLFVFVQARGKRFEKLPMKSPLQPALMPSSAFSYPKAFFLFSESDHHQIMKYVLEGGLHCSVSYVNSPSRNL